MKKGFILNSLLLATCLLATLIFITMRTAGMSIAAMRAQQEQDAASSKICIAIQYHQWLIRHRFDFLLSQSQQQKMVLVAKTPFDAVFRCGVAVAWRGAIARDGLLCETVVGKKCCRWLAQRKGEEYVFGGHTFTIV
ncbi:MAG: hypothetical protein QG632_281 [Candidatus Dependentiae bacterium]|nr:hypothetical protein [Candidatus Dependentiae bacterium]